MLIHPFEQLHAVIPCLLAGLCSLVVGIERQSREKSAGIRTHLLVCLGACLFTLASIWMSEYSLALSHGGVMPDPARLAAQIVSGIGFLGGGVILRDKNKIKGLTTASTIWVSAAMGVLCGMHLYLIAVLSSLITLLFLYIGRKASHLLRASMYNWLVQLEVENKEDIDLGQLKCTLVDILESRKGLSIINSFSDSHGRIKLMVNYNGSMSLFKSNIRQLLPPSLEYKLTIKSLPRSEYSDEYLDINTDF